MRSTRLFKKNIAKEAKGWVEDELIDQTQAVNICARYNVDYHSAENNSTGYNLLVGLGYLFIGISLIILIGANWDDLSREVRMFGLIATTLSIQGLAVRQYLIGNQASAVNGFILGNMFFGSSIILIAQIYHLGEHMPDGVFWWAIGCLPFCLITRSRALALQTLVLALIWFFLEVDLGFYPTLFPVFILSALFILKRGKQSILLFLTTIFSITTFTLYSLSRFWSETHYFNFQAEHVVVSLSFFICLYAFSHWLQARESISEKVYGSVLSLWLLIFGLIMMFVLSFEELWQALIETSWDNALSMWFLVLTISLISLLFVAKQNNLKHIALLVGLNIFTLGLVIYTSNDKHAIYFQVLCNIALIFVGVRLIMKGIEEGISHIFFLGVSTLLITAMLRYADLIGDYIGGAILFMIFAAILLGAAKYWKHINLQEASS